MAESKAPKSSKNPRVGSPSATSAARSPSSASGTSAVGLLLLCIAPMLFSCRAAVPYVPVLVGNYAFEQGNYQEATVHYLKALKNEQFDHWINYNLANVYHSLGELEAALELWDKSLQSDSVNLLFAIYYNRGILLYEQGRHEEAFESFKTALVHDPAHIGAKLNLELSLLKLQSGAGAQRNNLAEEKELTADSIRILEYVRRKEEQIWLQQNREQQQQLLYTEDW